VGYIKTAGLYSREDESVAVNEVWVLGVERHEFVEQDMGGGSQALRSRMSVLSLSMHQLLLTHRGARMATVRLESGIDLQVYQ
jgi:hypothetical protein